MAHIHFNQILIFTPITHAQMSWADPDDRQARGFGDPSYWKGLARTLERGCFDAVFFADTLAVPDDFEAGAKVAMEYGASYPRQDPFALIPYMADATEHLGFGVTLSTAGTPPFLAARRLGTLDNLTGGRVAWNVVTSHIRADFRALGLAQPDHDRRYDQADEYMEICYRLWDGFPREAIVADKKSGIFLDPAKIAKVDFDGQYYNCHAYPVTMCSPQGRPVIIQAGSSGRGMQFAVTHADAIYALQSRLGTMQKYMTQVRDAARSSNKAENPRVFFGIQPILGGTEEEAKRRLHHLQEHIPMQAALNRLSGMIGIDLGKYDLDAPLESIKTQASQGLLAATVDSMEGRAPTVREAAAYWGVAMGTAQRAGTPEQIADWIEELWRASGCYGFSISPTVSPRSIDEFVDHVVPILQKRGLMRTEYVGRTYRENLVN